MVTAVRLRCSGQFFAMSLSGVSGLLKSAEVSRTLQGVVLVASEFLRGKVRTVYVLGKRGVVLCS